MKSKHKKIEVMQFDTSIAGCSNKNTDGGDRTQYILNLCKLGSGVLLNCDQENPYDMHSISVSTDRDAVCQIGWIPKEISKKMSEYMHLPCQANITDFEIVVLDLDRACVRPSIRVNFFIY